MSSEVFLFGSDNAFPRALSDSLGLTKREYIAVHLMAASMANGGAHPATHAASAVNAADCLIAELNKGLKE